MFSWIQIVVGCSTLDFVILMYLRHRRLRLQTALIYRELTSLFKVRKYVANLCAPLAPLAHYAKLSCFMIDGSVDMRQLWSPLHDACPKHKKKYNSCVLFGENVALTLQKVYGVVGVKVLRGLPFTLCNTHTCKITSACLKFSWTHVTTLWLTEKEKCRSMVCRLNVSVLNDLPTVRWTRASPNAISVTPGAKTQCENTKKQRNQKTRANILAYEVSTSVAASVPVPRAIRWRDWPLPHYPWISENFPLLAERHHRSDDDIIHCLQWSIRQ